MISSNQIIGTGLSGLIGSRLVELNTDLNFTDISLASGYDILHPETLEDLFKTNPAKTVVHLAAFTDTNSAWEQKDDKKGLCYQINVIGTKNIIDLCQKYGKHLIHISTDYVFDGSKSGQYVETDIPNPLDWYGQTKFEAEKLIPPEFTTVRIAFPYRANFEAKVDMVRKIISKLSAGQICNLFSDQLTTPTFVDDIAFGLRKVVDTPKPGIFHLVGSSSQSIYELGLAIATEFGHDISLVQSSLLATYLQTPNARPYAPNLSLSNQKFCQDFNYTPKTLSEGLAEMKRQLSA